MNNTYWNENGKYQKEQDKLWEKYVPNEGYTDNKYINSFIAISKWYHDLYNNGLCNENVILKEIKEYIKPIKEELNINSNVYNNVLRSRIYIKEYEYPVYIYDEENECETEDVEYYETIEEPNIEELTEKDYKDFELLVDAIIELCLKKVDI